MHEGEIGGFYIIQNLDASPNERDKKVSDLGRKKQLKSLQKTAGNSSHVEWEPSKQMDVAASDLYEEDAKSNKAADARMVDISNKPRGMNPSPEPMEMISSERNNLVQSPKSSSMTTKEQNNERSTVPDALDSPPANGQDASNKPPHNGERIRKGRGFTKEYSFVRKYRTPSPERSPQRSRRFGGRTFYDRKNSRYSSYRGYSERSPPRRYRSPGRDRQSPRRSRSRSISRSPDGRHHHRRSPQRSSSPRERWPVVSESLRYRLGPRAGERRFRSRSRSPSFPCARSPEAAPANRRGRLGSASPSKSSSPTLRKGLVSYGDGSPDAGSS